jgi:hypothetical protein
MSWGKPRVGLWLLNSRDHTWSRCAASEGNSQFSGSKCAPGYGSNESPQSVSTRFRLPPRLRCSQR